MKKVFLGTFAAVALLFASCSNDTETSVDIPQNENDVVRVALTLDGLGNTTKAAGTATKPKTSWANIKDVRFFFVNDATGVVTQVVESSKAIPTGTNTLTENVLNLPAGIYQVVAVANTKAATSLTTFARGVASPWNATAAGQKFGTTTADLYIDAVSTTLPTAIGTSVWASTDKGYLPLSEVFVAVGKVTVVKDTKQDLALTLKREVSMLRVRVNKTINFLNEAGKEVKFNEATSSFMVHRVPQGLSFSASQHASNIYAELVGGTSDKDKIFVVSRDATTFKTGAANAADYDNPAAIVDANFTHWQDAIVFPNLSLADARNYTNVDDAVPGDQKYFIQFSALAPVGYVAQDGTVTNPAGSLVYWQGTVNTGLISNMIREVNVTIKTRGDINPPTDPTETGELEIVVSEPIPWDNSVSENIEI